MRKDAKRSTESKTVTLTLRVNRKNRTTEQRYTDRQYTKLLSKGF